MVTGIDPRAISAAPVVAWVLQAVIRIPGPPQPWQRPRTSAGRTWFSAPKHAAWERHAIRCMRAEWHGEPISSRTATRVVVHAVWERVKLMTPRSMGGTMSAAAEESWQAAGGLDLLGEPPAPTTRQDVDNVAKLALDALEKAGVLENDHSVTELTARKAWAEIGGEAYTEVQVWTPRRTG